MTKRVAVIGAGISGLTVASLLAGRADVQIFEKSRGVGGRMATRFTDDFSFDHGAQYFTVRSEAFRDFLTPFMESRIVAEWPRRLVRLKAGVVSEAVAMDDECYVGSSRMTALCKAIASSYGLKVRFETEIKTIDVEGTSKILRDRYGLVHGPFDLVVTAIPAPQAAGVVGEGTSFSAALKAVKMAGCFTLMQGYEESFPLDFEGAFVDESALGWIGVNHTKPGRGKGHSLILQSTNEWAEDNLEEDPQNVISELNVAFEKATGQKRKKPVHQQLHRWRYASVPRPAGTSFFLDKDKGLGACGDWCLKGRVEAAFESGHALGHALRDLV